MIDKCPNVSRPSLATQMEEGCVFVCQFYATFTHRVGMCVHCGHRCIQIYIYVDFVPLKLKKDLKQQSQQIACTLMLTIHRAKTSAEINTHITRTYSCVNTYILTCTKKAVK
ncbi:hypothetical protein ATANTOWER_010219 [Ataeniobius toweri]|uniref:Uncharacterized protein n=1 Tax=Ataeniobius toweri TaxID=208326 RepID=A0ABU7C682_9TELE|nr:hypothetical protein [Ataeniobius toweri]